MKCDECGKPRAKKVFVNWLCDEHALILLKSVRWVKPEVNKVILDGQLIDTTQQKSDKVV